MTTNNLSAMMFVDAQSKSKPSGLLGNQMPTTGTTTTTTTALNTNTSTNTAQAPAAFGPNFFTQHQEQHQRIRLQQLQMQMQQRQQLMLSHNRTWFAKANRISNGINNGIVSGMAAPAMQLKPQANFPFYPMAGMEATAPRVIAPTAATAPRTTPFAQSNMPVPTPVVSAPIAAPAVAASTATTVTAPNTEAAAIAAAEMDTGTAEAKKSAAPQPTTQQPAAQATKPSAATATATTAKPQTNGITEPSHCMMYEGDPRFELSKTNQQQRKRQRKRQRKTVFDSNPPYDKDGIVDPLACKRLRFPELLYWMLVYAEELGFMNQLAWADDSSFVINDPPLFTASLLRIFFPNHSSLRSFERMLNIWGFNRLMGGFNSKGRAKRFPIQPKRFEHYQRIFKRGDPNSSLQIERVQQLNASKQARALNLPRKIATIRRRRKQNTTRPPAEKQPMAAEDKAKPSAPKVDRLAPVGRSANEIYDRATPDQVAAQRQSDAAVAMAETAAANISVTAKQVAPVATPAFQHAQLGDPALVATQAQISDFRPMINLPYKPMASAQPTIQNKQHASLSRSVTSTTSSSSASSNCSSSEGSESTDHHHPRHLSVARRSDRVNHEENGRPHNSHVSADDSTRSESSYSTSSSDEDYSTCPVTPPSRRRRRKKKRRQRKHAAPSPPMMTAPMYMAGPDGTPIIVQYMPYQPQLMAGPNGMAAGMQLMNFLPGTQPQMLFPPPAAVTQPATFGTPMPLPMPTTCDRPQAEQKNEASVSDEFDFRKDPCAVPKISMDPTEHDRSIMHGVGRCSRVPLNLAPGW